MKPSEPFRCPAVALDEYVPHYSLQQWARGDTDLNKDRDEDEEAPEGYGGFNPGEIVKFHATHTLGRVTARVRDGKLVADEPFPHGTTRLIDEEEPECQGKELADFDACNLAEGDGIEILCVRDETEFWRCIGEAGDLLAEKPDTRDFEPATLLNWVNQFEQRYLAGVERGANPRVPREALRDLIWQFQHHLRREPEQPELPLGDAGTSQ